MDNKKVLRAFFSPPTVFPEVVRLSNAFRVGSNFVPGIVQLFIPKEKSIVLECFVFFYIFFFFWGGGGLNFHFPLDPPMFVGEALVTIVS